MAEFEFVTLDVFTETRFGGNPLAVVLDARGMSDDQMQRVAAEFGYAETTFVLPPRDPAHTAWVRIFTPVEEVPFAGHPNVGTGVALAERGSAFGRKLGDALVFEEAAGLVEVAVTRDGAGRVRAARIAAPQPLWVGSEIDPGIVAPACSLPVEAIETARHRPIEASVGLGFVLVELTGLEALAAARPDLAASERASAASSVRCHLMLYVRTGPGRLRARMFAPLTGVAEDPATGSASGALGAYVLAGPGSLVIEQGIEMGRPSRIDVERDAAGRVFIAGSCVPVLRGVLTLN